MNETALNNRSYNFFESKELSKIVHNIMTDLKFFHLEKHVNHRPPRNHFVYWKNSPAIYCQNDKYSLGIELFIDDKLGRQGSVVFFVNYIEKEKVFEDKFSVLPLDDITEKDLVKADYHFGLRELGNELLNMPDFNELFERLILTMKREMQFELLDV